ncbi:MAG: hypothetical protein Q9222_003079 [Ikaeria aurantiellina]
MTSTLSHLASVIALNTIRVDEYLEEHDLPQPSFDVDGPLDLGIKSGRVEKARHAAIDAATELLDLLQGPISCTLPKGFALAHGTDQNMFQYLKSRPDKAEQFARAMKFYTGSVRGNSESFLVEGYPWDSLGDGATVIDVGGSDGHVSLSLARRYPQIRFVIQDLPDVIESAANQKPPDMDRETIGFVPHDFFTPQILTADVYLFRWVFHDWPDKYVIDILRQTIPALKKGAKIIVNESLCPEPGSLPLSMERTVRFMDMIMLTVNNSRLRELSDWQQIFRTAHPGFGPLKCWTPEGAALAIIEVEWDGVPAENGNGAAIVPNGEFGKEQFLGDSISNGVASTT